MTSERSRNRDKSRVAHWNERYREGGNVGEEPSPLLLQAVQNVPPGLALELACGAGRNAIYLARLGWQVTAVDVSAVAIEMLERRAAQAKVKVDARLADLEAGEFRIGRDRYDLICNFYFLDRDLFAPIRRGIRPGGQFVASIHMHDDSPGVKPMNPAYLLSAGELRSYFNGWGILHYREGKPQEQEHNRRTAEIVVRRPE